jgi:flagellar biosynthesis chaperone FliJ
MPRPDAGLEVALEQRRRILEDKQQALSECERNVLAASERVSAAQHRVRLVLDQIEAAQQPRPGQALPVSILGDLERLLRWCDEQVAIEQARLATIRAEADAARAEVAAAHQQVRALELVLEARAAERAERQRRAELRLADETAASVHARKLAKPTH